MIKTLVGLGLPQTDAEIYAFLTTQGPKKGSAIAQALNIYKSKTCRSLKSLRTKGAVNASLDRPAVFSAVPIDKVLELFLKVKTEQAQIMQESRDQLLRNWQSMTKKQFQITGKKSQGA